MTKSFEELIVDLANEDEWIAMSAPEALAELGDKRAIPHLIREAGVEARRLPLNKAIREAIDAGQKDVWAIEEHHGGDIASLRAKCIEALVKLKAKEAIDLFLELVDETVGRIWIPHRVVWALGEMKVERAVPKIIKRFEMEKQKAEAGKTGYYELDVFLNSLRKIGTSEALALVKKHSDSR